MTERHEVMGLLLEHKTKAICDGCITTKFKFPVTRRANKIVLDLAEAGGCERVAGKCDLCGEARQVTRMID